MNKSLVLAVGIVMLFSMCSGIPFISDQPSISPGTVIVSNQDIYVKAQALPSEIRSGKFTNIMFEVSNANRYPLKNVNIIIYDPCVLTGETSKVIAELKQNRTESFSLKLNAPVEDITKNCNLRFRVFYDATYSLFQDVAVLKDAEYEQREASGTLGSVPISSTIPSSPLSVQVTFSDQQPLMDSQDTYLNINYYTSGSGLITVPAKGIKLTIPSNMKSVDCGGDFDTSFQSAEALSFVQGRASNSVCTFKTSASQAMDIKSLQISASYTYELTGAIPITVSQAKS
jgi:hypothetical protein